MTSESETKIDVSNKLYSDSLWILMITLLLVFSAEDAVCFELADIRNDEPVCCKEANIVPDVPSNSDSLFLCSEFQAEGYK